VRVSAPAAILALGVLLALAAAGCGACDRESDAAAVAERFHAALERGDGEAACAELSEETASKGGTTFLDEGPDGWEVSAAGCMPTAPNLPFDCVLEG
jgi:hypothetical protein